MGECRDAGGEQQVEIAAPAQALVVGLQVGEFVGVVHHQQAGPVEACQFEEQRIQPFLRVHLVGKLQAKRHRKQQQGLSDAFFAQHPGHVGVFVLIKMVVPGSDGGFAHPAHAIDEQQQVVAGK